MPGGSRDPGGRGTASDDELAVLVDRLRWERRRDPYRGRREYSQTVRNLAEAASG
jgi:hypothetical protein